MQHERGLRGRHELPDLCARLRLSRKQPRLTIVGLAEIPKSNPRNISSHILMPTPSQNAQKKTTQVRNPTYSAIAALSCTTTSPSLMVGLFPRAVGIWPLNSGGARPFDARDDATSVYGSDSSSNSHAIRMARLAPRKYSVMSGVGAVMAPVG